MILFPMVSVSKDYGVSKEEASEGLDTEVMILFGRVELGPGLVDVRRCS